jgi:phospholipid-binding lipoprotein MlaA
VKSGLLPVLVLWGAVLLGGCATPGATLESDPWEPMNRRIFWFNEQLDGYVLEPVAKGWDAITTPQVQRAVDRFFANMRFPVRLVNNLLQAELLGAAHETGRFVVNTTVGVLGLFDPAERWGLQAHPEDFGQTLAVWGISSGPYLVLPLFGPSNPRDTAGLVGDITVHESVWGMNPTWDTSDGLPATAWAVSVVNARAILLEPLKQAREASVDYYVFVRNAYLQRRRIAIEGVQDVPQSNGEDLYDDSLYDDALYDDALPEDDALEPAPEEPDVPQV